MSLSTSARRRRETIKALGSKGYRDAYVGQHIKRGIASQIRALREARGWTQGELARQTDKAQPVISGLENPDYGSYTLSTLKRLASAFDVALVVRFVPFSELVGYTSNITPADLAPVAFADDVALRITEFGEANSTANRSASIGSTRRHREPMATAQLPFLAFGDIRVVPMPQRPATTQASPIPDNYPRAAGGYIR